MQYPLWFVAGLSLLQHAYGYNFAWEGVQLTEKDTKNHPEIAFPNGVKVSTAKCKSYPGDSDWPTEEQWNAFNKTLGGNLIKPVPLALPCYAGESYNATTCASLQRNWETSTTHFVDPASMMNPFTIGNGCLPTSDKNAKCVTDGYAAYVVDARTVKHIQLAVNFARNQNIRLTIKNTGHDFLGRSAGGGSLSIWTHNVKDMAYHESVTIGNYTGKAVSLAAGVQAFDVYRFQNPYDITVIAPGGISVGAMGGFFQWGGHSTLTSFLGLAADQILSLQVVTADGRFLTADPTQNQDLFWAIRGGGGGTFGVVTSAIWKAHPKFPISSSSIAFSTQGTGTSALSVETFWKGIRVYMNHVVRLCDNGGEGYNFINPLNSANGKGYSFTHSMTLPNFTAAAHRRWLQPMIDELNDVGINIRMPNPSFSESFSAGPSRSTNTGNTVGNTRMSTRLFPRENFESEELLATSLKVIRAWVEEGGYVFHGINYAPTEEVSGFPDNAVNPALRRTVLHAEGFDRTPTNVPVEQQKAQWERLNRFMQPWRDITPGSYANEADVDEPNFQQSFYGSNYPRLSQIKKERDPWDLFYATTAVGSERWQVITPGMMKTQNGRLCKV
ncbi:FAD/FMN-containing isoamyl alcohol oxidase-like protein MreA [Patellaria atrata CBS 101060]|uniref:FAD/FMN-containing isoamyl alcohol oxidase-like protein MreA n=1 Tax=Patellaria atrata CBS 101060 TaxID=1346257 RepID=A0A9P4S9X8_9PEZI|nr:FAD/FMN-containing isoamyl alcohol oxidase-like protein MreA [Patellaria atrata CBS 101060]